MSSQNVVIALALCAVVIGGGWYFFSRTTSNEVVAPDSLRTNNESAESVSENSNVPEQVTGPRSLRALLGLGESLTCDYEYTTEAGGVIVGTTYIDQGRIRGDFEMEQAGQVYKSHMILKDDVMHTWTVSNQGTFGTTFEIPPSSESAPQNSGSVSIDEEIDYDCKPWTPTESSFNIPTNVEFRDMSALMQ